MSYKSSSGSPIRSSRSSHRVSPYVPSALSTSPSSLHPAPSSSYHDTVKHTSDSRHTPASAYGHPSTSIHPATNSLYREYFLRTFERPESTDAEQPSLQLEHSTYQDTSLAQFRPVPSPSASPPIHRAHPAGAPQAEDSVYQNHSGHPLAQRQVATFRGPKASHFFGL